MTTYDDVECLIKSGDDQLSWSIHKSSNLPDSPTDTDTGWLSLILGDQAGVVLGGGVTHDPWLSTGLSPPIKTSIQQQFVYTSNRCYHANHQSHAQQSTTTSLLWAPTRIITLLHIWLYNCLMRCLYSQVIFPLGAEATKTWTICPPPSKQVSGYRVSTCKRRN